MDFDKFATYTTDVILAIAAVLLGVAVLVETGIL
jgi:hypothetical protein